MTTTDHATEIAAAMGDWYARDSFNGPMCDEGYRLPDLDTTIAEGVWDCGTAEWWARDRGVYINVNIDRTATERPLLWDVLRLSERRFFILVTQHTTYLDALLAAVKEAARAV